MAIKIIINMQQILIKYFLIKEIKFTTSPGLFPHS